MKSKAIFIVSLILFFGGLIVYNHCNTAQKSKTLILYGNVDIRQVDLGFRIFGRVEKLFVDEGDRAETGQLLATLDDTPYQIEAAQNLANVFAIEANLENAIYKFERRDAMSEDAVSDEEYDDALFTTESLFAQLEQAKAALDESYVHIEDTRLLSPSNGTIITRVKEPGSIMNSSDVILTLSLDAPVWIRAYVTERELGTIYPGMKAYVTTDARPDEKIEAHIGFISPVAEFTPKSVETTTLRTELVYRLRVIVDNPPITMRQGMPVTVTLLYNTPLS